MACSDEDHGRSRRPGAEDRGWSHRSGTRWPGDREVGWRRVLSTLCTLRRGERVSWLSLKTKVDGLWVVWPQNHSDGFRRFGLKTGGIDFWQFGLKTCCDGFRWLASKLVATVFSSLTSKLVATVSPGLASKLVASFLVEPQNQCGGGFPSLGLKTDSFGLVIWPSKSPRQFLGLGLKTKLASVCRLRHKTNGGRSARDTHRDLSACFVWKQVWLEFSSLAWRLAEARQQVMHVAASQRSCRRQVEDGRVDTMDCVGPYYHTFTVFNVLCIMGIVVI
jgi:hypothetical protein